MQFLSSSFNYLYFSLICLSLAGTNYTLQNCPGGLIVHDEQKVYQPKVKAAFLLPNVSKQCMSQEKTFLYIDSFTYDTASYILEKLTEKPL